MTDVQVQIIGLLLVMIIAIQIVQARSLIRIRRRLRAMNRNHA